MDFEVTMYLDMYKIEGTINNDQNYCFHDETTYPKFQEELEEFKHLLIELVYLNEPKTFYKFGDGDYHFLKKESVGSASPGRRALSKSYDEIDHDAFTKGAQECDYYTCEIYPENRVKFAGVINRSVSTSSCLNFFDCSFPAIKSSTAFLAIDPPEKFKS